MVLRTPSIKMSRTTKFIGSGLPLILFVVGGSLSLSKFVQGRIEAKDLKVKSQSRRQYTLEEEATLVLSKLNIKDYDMIPVPRQSGPNSSTRGL